MRVFFFDRGVLEGPTVDLQTTTTTTTTTTTPPPKTTSGRGLATKFHQTESAAAAAVVRGAAAAAAAARHHFSPLHLNPDFNPHYNNAAALVNMLTPSSNQYLRPEYLSPLPTTLDAKKSPLALLAQTCSNIGADTPNSKSLIPPVEKSGSNFGNKDTTEKTSSSSSSSSSGVREKSTPHQSDDKSSFKPYESIKKEENGSSDTEKSGFRTPTSTKSSSPCVSRAGSVHSDKGCSRSSPANNSNSETTTTTSGGGGAAKSSMPSSSNSDTTTIVTSSSLATNPLNSISASMHSQHNRISIGCGNMFVEVNHHESGLPKDTLSAHLSSLGYKPGQLLPGLPPSSLLGSLSNCSGCTQVVGGHVPVDTGSTNPSFSHHHQSGGNHLKSGGGGGYPVGSALSPYVAYARVKTATGGTTLVPICRDPYCTNCQLSMQSAQQLVSCPSGCSQCNHEKAVAGLGVHHHNGGGGGMSGLIPGMVPGVVNNSSNAANVIPLGAGLYTSSMLTPRPYVCNWIAGDTYCGKRFTTSEELLQHLRTHTNLSAAESAAAAAAALNPLLNPSLSMPSAASLGAAGCHLHYSMAPSLTSPAGLHRTYPTSLSPVSSLSASRYHPYKPQLGGMPGAPPLSPFPPHPGFSAAAAAQYFSSPYAMYGQRLGAAVHP